MVSSLPSLASALPDRFEWPLLWDTQAYSHAVYSPASILTSPLTLSYMFWEDRYLVYSSVLLSILVRGSRDPEHTWTRAPVIFLPFHPSSGNAVNLAMAQSWETPLFFSSRSRLACSSCFVSVSTNHACQCFLLTEGSRKLFPSQCNNIGNVPSTVSAPQLAKSLPQWWGGRGEPVPFSPAVLANGHRLTVWPGYRVMQPHWREGKRVSVLPSLGPWRVLRLPCLQSGIEWTCHRASADG